MSRTKPPLDASSVLRALRGAEQTPEVVEYDQFVTDHIRHTGRTVQATDIAYAVATLAVGWLALLFSAALVEHWLTSDGLSGPVRFLLFFLGVAATAWYAYATLWPLVTRRINPLYTAHAIERSAPSLKNSLINLLTLRTAPKKMPPAVLAALEQQAAEGIVRAPEEAVVDRSRVVKMVGVCVGLIVLFALYALLSVKDPFTTAARVMAPWADIAPPSRVRVRDVSPGSVTLIEGERLDVAARITGLDKNEPAYVVVTSEDAQRVGDRIPLARTGEPNRFEVSLSTLAEPGPDGSGEIKPATLSGAARYRVEAGDGRSVSYDVRVVPAPAIAVTSVDYDYPEYTGYLDRTAPNRGDLRGVERTRVTLHATANTPLETAHVDFEADGSPDARMKVDGRDATVSFTLALRDDRRTPEHTSYALRVKSRDGAPNRKPAKHRIEVYPDYPPEAELAAPDEEELEVALNETVEVRATARDPDFALSRVHFRADRRADRRGDRRGEPVANQKLLTGEHSGRYDASYQFRPSDHGLNVGDVVDYWIEATDNRDPDPQTVSTHRQRFRVASPNPPEAPDDAQRGERDGEQSAEGGTGGEQGQQDGEQGDADGEGERSQGGAGQPDNGAQGEGRNAGGQGEADSEQAESGEAADGRSREGEGGEGESRGAQASENQSRDGAGDREAGQPRDADSADGGRGAEQPQPGEQSGADPANRQQTSDSGEGGAEQNREPVSSDGGDDAEAFDRIIDHIDENGESGEQSAGGGQPGEQPQGGGERQDQPQDGQANQRDGAGGEQSETDASDTGQHRDSDPSDSATSESTNQRQGAEDERSQAESRPADGAREERADPSDGQSASGEPGDDAGDQSNDVDSRDPGRQGAAQQEPQRDELGGRKTESMSDEPQQPQGGERSARESETPRDGAGEDGQNTSAEEGGGRSADRGDGETNERPGDQQGASEPTGRPGDERPGEGTRERPGEGDQPGGAPGDQSREQPGGEQPGESPSDTGEERAAGERGGDESPQQGPGGEREAAEGQPGQDRRAAGDDPSPGGQPSPDGAPTDSPRDADTQQEGDQPSDSMRPGTRAPKGTRSGGDVGGDDANLDYARQKTDLVLDRLSEQLEEQEVDNEMLEKLGWSEDDLRRFVERWRERKQAARRPDATEGARAELDAALRSLNLKPGESTARTRRTADELRNLSSGRRSEAPLRWRERLRQYNQGVSSAE